jgi:hypothetical protein
MPPYHYFRAAHGGMQRGAFQAPFSPQEFPAFIGNYQATARLNGIRAKKSLKTKSRAIAKQAAKGIL